MPPSLPPELLLQIVEAIDNSPAAKPTLRQLCLSSRLLLSAARTSLYRDITVTFANTERAANSSMAESVSM